MILRRLLRQVSEQNWFVVALDLFIVIVGILLGLQISEWNEARKERAIEQEYIGLLYEEMEVTQGSVQQAVASHSRRAAQLLELLAYLEGKQKTVPNDLAVQNSLCRWYSPASVVVQTATFDEVVSTGRLNLLHDRKLRKLLIQTTNRHKAVSFDFQVLAQSVQPKAQLLEPYILWQPTYSEKVIFDGDSENVTRCRVDLEKLKEAPHAVSIIAQLYRSQVIYQGIREEQAETIEQVMQYIKPGRVN